MAYFDTGFDGPTLWNSIDKLLDVAPCPPPWKPGLLYQHERLDTLTEAEVSVIARRCQVKKNEPFVLGPGILALIIVGAFIFVFILTVIYCRCKYRRTLRSTKSSNSFTSETELTPGGNENDSIEGDNPIFRKNEDPSSVKMKSYDTIISSSRLTPDVEMLDTIGIKQTNLSSGLQKYRSQT